MMQNDLNEIARLYPILYSEKKLDLWRALFSNQAKVTKIENAKEVSFLSISDAMPEQIEYANENDFFLETWENVDIRNYGSLAIIKADYILETNSEIRKGIDLLTLIYDKSGGWRIYNLVYEQMDFIEKS